MSYLGLEGKTFVVTGLANKKSVAWHVARGLKEAGAHVVHVVPVESYGGKMLKVHSQLCERSEAVIRRFCQTAFQDLADAFGQFITMCSR